MTLYARDHTPEGCKLYHVHLAPSHPTNPQPVTVVLVNLHHLTTALHGTEACWWEAKPDDEVVNHFVTLHPDYDGTAWSLLRIRALQAKHVI